MEVKSLPELITPDPRIHYWQRDGSLNPAAEYDISATWQHGRTGEDGWSDGYVWHIECRDGTLLHANDLGPGVNTFRDLVNHWLLPLTGYTREEFIELATSHMGSMRQGK